MEGNAFVEQVLEQSHLSFKHKGHPADQGQAMHCDYGNHTFAPAAWKWLGIVAWRAWIEGATPAERELLGFPPPGHEYWTKETLAGVGARYPRMDMVPYRDAARASALAANRRRDVAPA